MVIIKYCQFEVSLSLVSVYYSKLVLINILAELIQ